MLPEKKPTRREKIVAGIMGLILLLAGLATIGTFFFDASGYFGGRTANRITTSDAELDGIPPLSTVIQSETPTMPTSTSSPTNTLEPLTPRPTATSSARSTDPPAPTPTPRPTVTPAPTATAVPPTATQEQVKGVTMDTVPSQEAQSGQGLLSVSFAETTESISGVYVEVHSLEIDALQSPIAGERVAYDSTGSSGSVIFDLDPGEYVVLANLPGYSWGTLTTDEGMANVVVREGHSTELSVRLGRLTVEVASVDQAISGQYVEVHTQRPDVNGNPVPEERVDYGSTDDGSISFILTSGDYIVESGFNGYNWGDATSIEGEADIVVTPGEETIVVVPLGQIAVTVRDAEGGAASGVYLELFTEVPDASGDAVPGERVDYGSTENTGVWSADVTPGTYCIEFDGTPSCGWEVEAGSILDMEFTDSQE